MKTMIVVRYAALAVVLALTTVGCSKERDARIAELERQMQDLQSKYDDQGKDLLAVLDAFADYQTNTANFTRMLENLQYQSGESWRELEGIAAMVDEHQAMFEAYKGKRPVRVYSPAASTTTSPTPYGGTKMGVPVVIYNKIAADAREKWGNNYDMQEYEVNKQVEAYKNLHR